MEGWEEEEGAAVEVGLWLVGMGVVNRKGRFHRVRTNNSPQHQQQQPPPTNEGESFPELEAALTAAIEALGGAVCPKLNWSVPRDAEWVNGGTLRCETAGDVMLLLKSSDFVQHDLERMCV